MRLAPCFLTAFYLSTALSLTAADLVDGFFVEGYAGQVSYAPDDSLTVHVSTSESSFSAEIFRLGAEKKSVWKKDSIAGAAHAILANASSGGCAWPAAFEIEIPADWTSGYYQVELRAADGGGVFVRRNRRSAETSCFFVLREASGIAQPAPILLQLATNTYNAYNNWGGFSLYAYHGRGGNQGHRVSFQRPPASLFSRWEQDFVAWAEREGIQLAYCANADLEFRPEVLEKRRLVLSIGHDEYWSAPMRDRLEAFIGGGGNVAFFSGNTCCWQVRSEDGGNALTCWKQNYHSDPIYGARGSQATLSSLWSHHLVERPENQLTGVGFLWGGYHRSHGQYMDGSGAFTVHRPEHWLFEGTGLKLGDALGGKHTVVGYECDGCEIEWRDGLPFPTSRDGTPESFQILGTAPARWHPDDCEWYDRWENGRDGHAVLGVYQRGGTVVTTGSTDWVHGLRGGDPAIERITRNVISRLSR
ncbi:MAG: N,N-dimethylformamidase beta subunit family domain-containing protein [Verrucomicrobiales bacterium]